MANDWFTTNTRGGYRPWGVAYDVQRAALARAEVLYSVIPCALRYPRYLKKA